MTSNNRLPLHKMTAHEAVLEIAAQRLTAEQLVCACLDRIAEREPLVQAWSFIDRAAALKQAKRIDDGPWRGLLHGIPIGVKDIIDTYDMPTECGSPIYRGRIPHCDAACVAMARAAGAIILGKTVTTEFATRHPGKTANPHDSRYTPGGSSSGSAAAVADQMVPLALGTQTGGSIIRPASFCGVVGFKPSFGLVNRAGVKQVSDTLDTVGVFARDVTDVAVSIAALSGRSELATLPKTPIPRIAICRTFDWDQASIETHEALDFAKRTLCAAKAHVTEIGLPPRFLELGNAHRQIQYFELSRALRDEYERHPEQLSDVLKSWIDKGLTCPGDSYDRQLQFVANCRQVINHLFDEADVLLTPSAVGEATLGLKNTGSAVFNSNWTALGLPCLNISAYRGPNGLPVGIQVVGRYRNDDKVLAFANWIYQTLNLIHS